MSEQQAPRPGTFAWNELGTRNVDECRTFYTELLGWEALDMPMPTGMYTVFQKGGVNVGGMWKMGEEMGNIPSHWLSYIAVEDVDVATARAEQLGAKIQMPPTDIPEIGRFSVVMDPGGAVFSLMTFLPMEGEG